MVVLLEDDVVLSVLAVELVLELLVVVVEVEVVLDVVDNVEAVELVDELLVVVEVVVLSVLAVDDVVLLVDVVVLMVDEVVLDVDDVLVVVLTVEAVELVVLDDDVVVLSVLAVELVVLDELVVVLRVEAVELVVELLVLVVVELVVVLVVVELVVVLDVVVVDDVVDDVVVTDGVPKSTTQNVTSEAPTDPDVPLLIFKFEVVVKAAPYHAADILLLLDTLPSCLRILPIAIAEFKPDTVVIDSSLSWSSVAKDELTCSVVVSSENSTTSQQMSLRGRPLTFRSKVNCVVLVNLALRLNWSTLTPSPLLLALRNAFVRLTAVQLSVVLLSPIPIVAVPRCTAHSLYWITS